MFLPAGDVLTDMYTGYSFFSNGDVIWGGLTIFLVFFPFLVWTVSVALGFCAPKS